MSILTDRDIRRLCVGDPSCGIPKPACPLLSPFIEGVQEKGVISMGLTSAGYDLRLGQTVLVFKNTRNIVIDPKAMKSDKGYQDQIFDRLEDIPSGERVIIPPNSYILGYSLEHIRIPANLKGTCVGKSTLARCGVLVNTTPLEPSWTGFLTIEIANVTPCPVAVYVGEGIAQVEFHTLSGTPETTYADKRGKYQSQGREPVPARLFG